MRFDIIAAAPIMLSHPNGTAVHVSPLTVADLGRLEQRARGHVLGTLNASIDADDPDAAKKRGQNTTEVMRLHYGSDPINQWMASEEGLVEAITVSLRKVQPEWTPKQIYDLLKVAGDEWFVEIGHEVYVITGLMERKVEDEENPTESEEVETAESPAETVATSKT